MKIVTLNKLLLEKGWQVIRNHQEHHVFGHPMKTHSFSLITPCCNTERVPIGTLNATIRLAHKTAMPNHWTMPMFPAKTLKVVLEKHKTKIWGRIETPGLLVTTHGHCADDVSRRLRSLLTDYGKSHDMDDHSDFESIPFEPVYDTTAVWELIRQLKANHIAGQTGIDTALIGEFMTGSMYPSAEQAERLEASIHELGRQLLQLSIR